MFRALTALGVLALVAATATAQPGRLPLSPGVVPAAPFAPGIQPMTVRPVVTMQGPPNLVFLPVVAPLGFSSYPYSINGGFGFFGGYGGYGYAPFTSITVPASAIPYPPPLPASAEAPRRAEPTAVLAREFPATLTVQFPAAAEVWLDGKKVEGSAVEERVLTSPTLKPGEQHTFALKARWTAGGKTYEATRSVKVSPGDRSRLFVVSGEEVR
jgi:uncharacterized protein (TIGR03000 family)